ncbi:uncharacterized protein [Acropora muricata]|uniref:uncharacterized protein isoform X2 n=1 Tax=Acropora muricata TaxID=159855 RepID=UPI0034E49081
MASTSKRARVEENESDDSDSSFDFIEENTEGMDSGEESELDRLLADESEISSGEEVDFELFYDASETEGEECEGVAGPSVSLPSVPPAASNEALVTAASGPIGAASFYGAAASRPRARARPGPRTPALPVRGGGGRGQARGGGRGRGSAQGGWTNLEDFKSEDVGTFAFLKFFHI